MTSLREAAQQALEALEKCRKMLLVEAGWSLSEGDAGITALRAALAQPDACTWWQDGDSDSGTYGTSCGHYFSITDGTPKDNKMQWCCYCGKKLVQELITEDDDE